MFQIDFSTRRATFFCSGINVEISTSSPSQFATAFAIRTESESSVFFSLTVHLIYLLVTTGFKNLNENHDSQNNLKAKSE